MTKNCNNIFAKTLRYLSLVMYIFIVPMPVLSNCFNIVNLGAKPGKAFLNTEIIQGAIDSCSKKGGRVIIPAGTFKTGSLILRSNITIYLENGAILLGSEDANDYPVHSPEFPSYTNRYQLSSLLFAENEKNITIKGDGIIDCNGGAGDFYMTYEEWRKAENEKQRPFGILMRRCKNIEISGVELRNSAFWMQQYLECENLRLINIDVENHANYNNDGVDINNCKDAVIQGCCIYCSDDAIAVKSTTDGINQNIVISDCILRSHYNGFKIGTETMGGVKNLVLSNCVIGSPGYENHHGSNNIGYCGIAIECCDGAVVEDITIENITIDNMMSAFFIRLENRGRLISDQHERKPTGTIRNINLNNIMATGMTKLSSSITGIPGHYVQNIRMNNIQLFTSGGGTENDIHKPVPERESAYPDVVMFNTNLPSYGFFIRHARNIFFSDINIHTNKPDIRHGIVLDDVVNGFFDNLFFHNSSNRYENIKEKDCQHIHYSNISKYEE